MSITLKNITAADTISSMVDKINFNFDQLLLNGGGIEGPRGIEGYPGMQGNPGEQGLRGPQGETGERGVHFHILPLGDSETDPSVIYATIYGLDETDPTGDEYRNGDMIIAYTQDPNTNAKYLDSLWKVQETVDNFYPLETNILFSQNSLFEEISVSDTNNTIIRTKYSNSSDKRGLVLNDYNHHMNTNNISDELINDVIDHNIVLIYTDALSEQNSSGSPHCGIVFYKNEDPSSIGSFPRINYVVSPSAENNGINYFNIAAPSQGLRLTANNDIFINSIEGNITIKTTDVSSEFSLERADKQIIISKKEGDVNELHLCSDEIFIEKENIASKQWLKIKDKNYTDENSCEITLCKQQTYISSDFTFSIGKTGLETRITSESENDYFNQSRILIENAESEKHIDIISPKILLGRDPLIDDIDNFGIAITQGVIKETAQTTFDNGTDKAKIELNTEKNHSPNVLLGTTYPGVTTITNVSEKYLDCIINYVEPDAYYTDDPDDPNYNYRVTDNYVLYTAPMGDGITKSGRYNYANINCYQNMSIRNINNMGAVHAGSILFSGRYGSGTVNDYLTYDFVRVGNVVHCTFHGTIDTNKLCARNANSPNVTKKYDYKTSSVSQKQYMDVTFGESFFKSDTDLLVNWPTSNSISSKLPTYMSAPTINSLQLADSQSVMVKASSYSATKRTADYVLPTLSMVSLNRLYLNLYPPIVKVTKSGTNTFKTNIEDFNGHMTYSTGGAIYQKELVYTNTITKSSDLLKLPAITIRDMKNSSNVNKITGSGSSIFTLAGATTSTIVEINGYFSYVLNCKSDDMHSNRNGLILGNEANIADAVTYTSGNSVEIDPVYLGAGARANADSVNVQDQQQQDVAVDVSMSNNN